MCKQKSFSTEIFGAQRLIFLARADNDDPYAEQANSEPEGSFTLNRKIEDYPTLEAYRAHLEEAQTRGLIDEAEKTSYLNEYQREANKKKREAEEENTITNLRAKIEKFRREEKQKEINQAVKARLDAEQFESFAELRQFIRSEIEALGIPFKDVPSRHLREFIQFESSVISEVKSILGQSAKYAQILKEIEADQESAEKCYQKFKQLYQEKRDFLEFLNDQGIPNKELRFNVSKILEIAAQVNFDDAQSFYGLVDPIEIMRFSHGLDLVTDFAAYWEQTTGLTNAELQRRLTMQQREIKSYKDTLESLGEELRNPQLVEPELIAIKDLDYQNRRFLEELTEVIEAKKQGRGRGQQQTAAPKEITPTYSRLIESFILSQNAKLQKRKIATNQLVEQQGKLKAIAIDSKERPFEDTKFEPKFKEVESHHHQIGEGPFANFNKALKNFITAKGQITYYSWYDVVETFKLVAKAFEQHGISASEDKRGTLGKKLVFWRPEIQRRVHHIDISEEKHRAEELKKTYELFDRERLISELRDNPNKDRTRAILETLAKRGNLLMSDQELVDIVCPDELEQADWDEAYATSNYDYMRDLFKKRIEEKMHEVGYGQQLIDMQTSGYGTAVDNGKKLVSADQTLSVAAEIGIFDRQTADSTLEGEGKVFGMVETAVGRANVYSGNGRKGIIMKLNVAGKNQEVANEANMGFYGLRLVDARLKGQIHDETINNISKKHESGFNPFACFADLMVMKTGKRNGRQVAQFEEWGWIDTTPGKTPTITELGRTEIVNFFNTRNAVSEAEDGTRTFRHLVFDNVSYRRHSRRHSSIRDALHDNIKVGDKLASYVVKNAALDLFYSASQQHKDRPGETVGEIEELASLLKSGVEDFEDGAQMLAEGDRYYDPNDEVECDKYGNKDPKLKLPPTEYIRSRGRDRLERGRNILTTIMDNIAENTKDTKPVILQVSGQYENRSLADFLRLKLDRFKGDHRLEYARVMRSLQQLLDQGSQGVEAAAEAELPSHPA